MVAKRFTVTVHRKGAKNAKEYLKEENKTFNSFPNHVLMDMRIVWERNGRETLFREGKETYDMFANL